MMDIYNSYHLDEVSNGIEVSDSDSSDEDYDTDNYHLCSNGLERKLIKPYIENKQEHIQGLELHSKNTYSSKLKSHSVRVKSIRESVHQCKSVLAAIVEKDYKDILNAFNNGAEEVSSPQLFAAMCLHHVSSLSYTEKLNISNILNNLPEYIGRNTDNINANCLDLFFRNLDPERCFDLISRIWHLYLDIENTLKYSFCKKLIESERPRNERFLCANIKNLAYLWKTDNGNRKDPLLLLSLLYHAVTSEQIEDVKFIKSIIATHMDCKELVKALTIYKLNCNTAKLLSFSMLILNLDDILMTCPQQKLWLLFSYLSNLLALKHYEGFKATVIHFQQFFLSDNCIMIRISSSPSRPVLKHAYSTLLLHLLYFCITTNQHEKKLCALSEILAIANHVTDDMTGSINFFFSLITNSTDRNNQHSLIFTEVLLQLWEKRMDLKMAVMDAYIAYLRKSKCLELHGSFVQYHFQCLKSTSFLGLSQYGSNLEWDENILFVIHHISNLSEMTSFNIRMNETKFLSSFRQYVKLCDETQILCVPDTIEKVGIILESDKILIVHAILIYGTELFKRACFERYKWLVIRHQSLLIFELPKLFNLYMMTEIHSKQICFVTCLNLLQHYTIFDQCTKMKRLRSQVLFCCEDTMQYIFSDYMSTHGKEQFISTSLSLQYIWKGIRNSHTKLQCLVIFWKKISESGCTDQFKDFIVDNKDFILSMKDAALDYDFDYKTEHCVLLFYLLRECIMSNNNRDMNLALSAIIDQKRNMLNDFGDSLKSKPNEIAEEERNFLITNYSRLYTIDKVLNGNLELHEYVRAVIDHYRYHSKYDSVFKIFTYYLQNLTTVQQEKGLIGLIAFVGDAPIEKRYYDNINCEISSLMFDVVYSFLVLKHEVDQTKLATFLLNLSHKCHSKLVKKVTIEAGKILKWKTLAPQNITTEENMVIYKCFCIVRQSKKTYRVKEINLKEYISYFDFIEMIDQEEQRQRIIRQTILLLVLLLLLTSITSDGHHKSAKLKKFLSLKYEYDDLALYLLWCSGDVEINPGPTFFKIRPLYASEKERKWICEVCSVLVKLVKELPLTSKPKSLWTQEPKRWPKGEDFFDPNNISTVQSGAKSKKDLLKCLKTCCVANEKTVPDSYQIEIDLFENNKKKLLFETYIFRKEKHNICTALSNILMFKDRGEIINQDMKNCGLTLNFGLTQTSQYSDYTEKKEKITEVRRDLAVLLCKIIKGRPIHEKCDGLWEKPPTGWSLPPELFYSPHNKKKRQGICPDKELVNNLIKYCNDKSNSVEIPSKYQVMVTAWTEGNIDELIKIHIIYANITKLEHALKYLQIEGILAKPDSLDFLEKQGLTLDTDTWKLKDRQKDGNHTASREQSQRLIGNPLTSEELAIKKSSSCNKRDTKLQKLSTPQQTAELYENILVPSTNESKTVDAEPVSPESPSTSEELAIKKSSSCNKRDTKLQKLRTLQQTSELYENTLLPSTNESKTVDAEPFSPEYPSTSEELAIKKSSSCNKRDTKLQKLSTPQQTSELYENTLLPSTDESKTVDAEPFSPESPLKSKELAIKKSSSCNERDKTLQKLSTPQETAELYENTLLPSTDESKTVDAESFSLESSFKKKTQLKLSGSEERSSQKRRLDIDTFDQEEHEDKKKQKLNNCLYETSLTQEEEDKLKRQLDEPVPPLSEESKKWCPADLEYSDVDNMINDFMKSEQAEDLENFINIDY